MTDTEKEISKNNPHTLTIFVVFIVLVVLFNLYTAFSPIIEDHFAEKPKQIIFNFYAR